MTIWKLHTRKIVRQALGHPPGSEAHPKTSAGWEAFNALPPTKQACDGPWAWDIWAIERAGFRVSCVLGLRVQGLG